MSYSYNDNDNVYMNIVFDHSQGTFTGAPVTPPIGEIPEVADYNVTKTIPILAKCSDYFVSVIRFVIPLDTIPLAVMPIIPNQGNANLTPMIIGINYLGTDYPVSVLYIPDNNQAAPDQNQPTQVITPYYYTYTYQKFIFMFNVALNEAWIDSGLGGPDGVFPNLVPPFLYLNPATQLVSIVVNSVFTTIAGGQPFIFWNQPVEHYLEAIEVFFYGYNQPNGKDFQLSLNFPTPDKFYAPLFTPATDIAPAITYYQFTQEYPVLQYWTSLRKIIISTNTIPIINEYIPSSNNSTNPNGVAASFPVLTDYAPAIELAGQSRAIAYYFPTSQYRLVDMVSDSPLQKVDLKIFWEDVRGNLYPLTISLFQQASVKLAFLKKSLYKPARLLNK